MPGQRYSNRRGQTANGQLPLDFAYGHVQPQALDVEKAVLGALMIDRDAYMEVCEVLHIESFYEPRNQKIYAAIQQLSMEEKWPWICGRTEFESCHISQHWLSCQYRSREVSFEATNFIYQHYRHQGIR